MSQGVFKIIHIVHNVVYKELMDIISGIIFCHTRNNFIRDVTISQAHGRPAKHQHCQWRYGH